MSGAETWKAAEGVGRRAERKEGWGYELDAKTPPRHVDLIGSCRASHLLKI